ncbi:MAG: glycosyltransferase family 2 protein [Gemmataceae bacterium]|nr:glycosyltransferase family 2 protein [Gemmataceae bacterium]MDW8263751.1 glycosyltransferase family 2 protein [Gemmataceae bacterium]
MPLISVVVPVYHNEASLPELLDRLQRVAEQCPDDRFEFIFVDDGSTDGSWATLQRLACREPRMVLIRLVRNFGSNAALGAGLEQARGDAVVAVAADLQDPPELVPHLLAHWRRGSRVVLAARQGRDDPWLPRLAARLFYALFRHCALPTMPPQGFDFFLIDRCVVDLVVAIQEKNAYLMGLILWLGFRPEIVPYRRQARRPEHGRSMWTLARKIKYAIDCFVAFSYFPIRCVSGLGLVLSVLGGLYATWIVIARLTRGIGVEGWSSLMVVLLVTSGLQMLMTGLLGEYLWRSLDETRPRPRFVIDTIQRSDGNADRSDACSERSAA